MVDYRYGFDELRDKDGFPIVNKDGKPVIGWTKILLPLNKASFVCCFCGVPMRVMNHPPSWDMKGWKEYRSSDKEKHTRFLLWSGKVVCENCIARCFE